MKFQLPTGSLAILEASQAFATAEVKRQHQVTTYFDTPDCVLDRAGLTLRVRRIGDVRIQTVKSRANRRGVATSRPEWDWEIGQDSPVVAELFGIGKLVKVAEAIKGLLVPMFITDIHRTTRLLYLRDDTIVEAGIDEGCINAGSACEPVSELELELKSGTLGPMYQLAVEVQTFSPMCISTESKSARGWHLRTGQTEGAQEAQTPKLGRRIRAAGGFCAIVSETMGHLIGNIAPTRRGDAEGIHQMRIALRASRAALNLFEPRLNAKAMARFDAALQGFGRILGTARDWDMFCLQTLPAAMADLPAERLWDLKQVAEAERQVAHAAVVDAMSGQHLTATVLGLAAWTEGGAAYRCSLGDGRMGRRLAPLAPFLLDRVAADAKRHERHLGKHSAEKRHCLRKSLDRLCDDVKFLTGLFPRRAVEDYRDRCEDVQAILGLANDAVVTQRLVLTLVSDLRPDLAKPAGALSRWSDRRGRKALRGLGGALKDFRAARVFWQ